MIIRGLTGRIAAAGLVLLLLIGGSFAGLFVAIERAPLGRRAGHPLVGGSPRREPRSSAF